MKWLRSVVLVCLLICITVTAIAEEEFSVRNGIKFGMKSTEITAKEKEDGNDTIFLDESNALAVRDITVAGIANSNINYFLDSDDALYSINYDLASSTKYKDNSFYESDFSTIEKLMKEKYGAPDLSSKKGDTMAVRGKTMESALKLMAIAYSSDLYCKKKESSKWLIMNDDGSYLKIEHALFRIGKDAFGYKYGHFIGYQLFSSDEVKEKIESHDAEQADIDDDL